MREVKNILCMISSRFREKMNKLFTEFRLAFTILVPGRDLKSDSHCVYGCSANGHSHDGCEKHKFYHIFLFFCGPDHIQRKTGQWTMPTQFFL